MKYEEIKAVVEGYIAKYNKKKTILPLPELKNLCEKFWDKCADILLDNGDDMQSHQYVDLCRRVRQIPRDRTLANGVVIFS